MPRGSARRAFIIGRFADSPPMRPMGALPDMDFEETCSRCGDCVSACEENIITLDPKGFPVADLKRGECTFCMACTEACADGALVAGQPWLWRASVDASCLSSNGVQCRVCQDHCPTGAIRFRLKPGGRSELDIDLSECNGCGACAGPCPADAIQFTQTRNQRRLPYAEHLRMSCARDAGNDR